MKEPLFDESAARRTVSLTLNSDLYARAKAAGINVSRVAEQALAGAYAEKAREALRAQMAEDIRALDAFAEKYGSFSEGLEEWKQGLEGPEAGEGLQGLGSVKE
jgi:post-segregation antitoxin (ccd killing protein)